MPVVYSQHKSTTATAWRWPLQIGIMPDAPELIGILHQGYWSSRFTELKVLAEKEDRVNILLFSKGFANAMIHMKAAERKADIIIIIEAYIPPYAVSMIQDNIKFAAGLIAPAGLFIVSPQPDLSTWFENMIVELSHDKNILEAIQPQITDGFLFYDPKIGAETRLSNIVRGIVHGLNTGFQRPGTVFHIDSSITGKQTYTPKQLADFLAEKLPGFTYDHESDTASGIAELTKVLYERYNDDDFHQLVKKPAVGIAFDTRGLESVREVAGPRFLQTRLLRPAARSIVENYLLPGTDYLLHIRIGLEEAGWSHDTTPVDTDGIFKNRTAKEEPIDIVFRPLDGTTEQKTTVTLPRIGNSTIAGFTFRPGTEEYFIAEIEAFHHNKLLQKLRWQIRIRTEGQDAARDGITTKLVFCSRTDFSNLPEETKYDASFTYKDVSKEGAPAGSSLSGMTGGTPLSLYFSDPLADLMNEIKGIIQKTILDIDNHPEDLFAASNVDVLRKLALKGNKLFVQHLRKHDLKGPLQIVTNRPGFVPLDFVYQPAPPGLTATLCPGAKTALEQGACASCYDKTTSPAPYICPFGFWGFSQVIERSAMEREDALPGDYLITAQPTKDRRTLAILNNTLHASSKKVDGAVSDIRKQVSDTIIKNSLKAVESSDWDTWKKITQEQNPDSMILIVHVEKELQVNEYQIEIGDQQFLLQNYFDTSMIKPVPEERSPFMIVIGCETSKLDSQGFDISSKLIQEGAAIVLSNFTKISGRRAGPIVIKLIEYLKEQKEDQLLGQVMLRLRQYLLSQGILAGLSLVAYGDADWKLTTT